MIDTGPGVPLEEREAIFDAFFRGRAGASGRAEGTGLGLAIARDFVTGAHGGRIEVVPGSTGGHFRRLAADASSVHARRGGMRLAIALSSCCLRQDARLSGLTHRMPLQSAKSSRWQLKPCARRLRCSASGFLRR